MNIEHRTSNIEFWMGLNAKGRKWKIEILAQVSKPPFDKLTALRKVEKLIRKKIVRYCLFIRRWTLDVRCSTFDVHSFLALDYCVNTTGLDLESAGLENLTEMRVGENFVENINLFFQFSLVLKRHTEFQGRPFKILRREQADPAAQVKLSQVTLEWFFR